MSAFVPLCPRVRLNGRLRLFFSANAFLKLRQKGVDYEKLCLRLSAARHLLVYREKDWFEKEGKKIDGYMILTEFGILCCLESQEKNLAMADFWVEYSSNRSKLLRDGVTFSLFHSLSIAVQEGNNLFHNFAGGKRQEYGDRVDCTETIRAMDRAFDARREEIDLLWETKKLEDKAGEDSLEEEEDEIPEGEANEISPDLSELLRKAEQYAEFDYSMAQLAAAKRGNIHYNGVEGARGTHQEKTVLRFRFARYARIKDLKTGTIVNVKDRNERILGAKICGKSEPEEEKVYLDLSFPGLVEYAQFPQTGSLTLTASPKVMKTQMEALERIREEEENRLYFENILGSGEPREHRKDDLSELEKELSGRARPMTQKQIEAVKKGITAGDACLVMGPPGTGKTTVILEWVKYFTQKKRQRILIASQNNTAVDNVLKRLLGERGFDILRIGNDEKIAPEVAPLQLSEKLRSARERIGSHCRGKTAEWIALYDHWTEVLRLVEAAQELRKEIKTEEQQFAPFVREMERDQREISEETERLYTYRRKILGVGRSLFAIREGRGWWGLVPERIRSLWLKNRKSVILTASMREKEMQQRVNLRIGQYNRYSQTLYEKCFLPHRAHRKELDALLEKINENWQTHPLFFPLDRDSFSLSDAKRLKVMLSEIEQGLARLEKGIGILQRWEDDIENAQNYALQSLVTENVNVVGATCIGSSNNRRFADIKYDVTIIDEAGQIRIHDCLVPMTRSKKLIMLGDHKQLPPTTDPTLAAVLRDNGMDVSLYQSSLFERMYEAFPEDNKVMLNTQFRIPKPVADFLSEQFYNGEYETGLKSAPSCLKFLSPCPLVLVDTSDSEDRFQYPRPGDVLDEEESGDVWNPYESRLIARLYQKLSTGSYAKLETKILAGLNKQVINVRDTLTEAFGHPIPGAVSTVDSFQGQECDVVIYSFTRSVDLTQAEEDMLQVGFLADLRRLNVAMSRAKKALIVVGDFSYLDARGQTLANSGRRAQKFARFIRALKQTAKKTPDGCEIIPSLEVQRRLEAPER